jgi:hypothetical protein
MRSASYSIIAIAFLQVGSPALAQGKKPLPLPGYGSPCSKQTGWRCAPGLFCSGPHEDRGICCRGQQVADYNSGRTKLVCNPPKRKSPDAGCFAQGGKPGRATAVDEKGNRVGDKIIPVCDLTQLCSNEKEFRCNPNPGRVDPRCCTRGQICHMEAFNNTDAVCTWP